MHMFLEYLNFWANNIKHLFVKKLALIQKQIRQNPFKLNVEIIKEIWRVATFFT